MTEMTAMVSIVMPVYNAGMYLEKALSDILKLNYKNIEVICVNDGSTDSSLQILKKISEVDKRIVVLDSPNIGAANARNLGFSNIKGKYVLFLDADDRFEEGMLDIVAVMEKQSCDMGIFDYDRFSDTDGHIITSGGIEYSMVGDNNIIYRDEIAGDNIFNFCENMPWNKIYRSELIGRHGLEFQSLQHANDMYFVLASMIYIEKIAVDRRCLLHYRDNNKNSISGKRIVDSMCVCKALLAIKDELNKSTSYKKYSNSFFEKVIKATIWDMAQFERKQQLEVFDFVRKEFLIKADRNILKRFNIREKLYYYSLRKDIFGIYYLSNRLYIFLKGIFK